MVLKRQTTTHVRILKRDKQVIDNLVRRGVYANTATAIHKIMLKAFNKRKR